MDALPDLTTFTVLHRALRSDALRLAGAVADLTPAGAADRGGALVSWYGRYRRAVHEHHTAEDELFFPALVERVPVSDRHLGRVDAEHHRLAEVVDELHSVLPAMVGAAAGGDWDAAHGTARATTAELADLMVRHLDFEDADVLPLYVRHFGAQEYEDLSERAMRNATLGELVFVVPWAMEHGTGPERASMLEHAPFAFRLLWYATRGRHDRRVRAAFTGRDPRPVTEGGR